MAAMIFHSLAVLAAYAFACLSLGTVLLRAFAGRQALQNEHTPAARVASAFLLGGGVLANLWLVVSLVPAGLFRLPVVGGLTLASAAVGAVPAARDLVAAGRHLVAALRDTARTHWAWAIGAGATLVLPLLYALAAALPPRGDAAAFYFSLPRLLAHEGVLRPLPGFEFFSQLGLHGEMHVAALMVFGSPQAATLLAGFLGVPAAMLLMELARRAGLGRLGRWTVLLLTYTSTAFVFLTFGGRLDLFSAALSLAAVYWAMCVPLRGGRIALLAGVLGCWGVIAKATCALTTVPMLTLLLAWRMAVSESAGRRGAAVFRAGGWCLLGAVVAAIPHLAKNVVLYGADYALAPFVSPPGGYVWAASKICSDSQALHVLRTFPLAVFWGQFPGMFGTMSTAALAFWPLVLLLPRPEKFSRSVLVQLTVVGAVGAALYGLLQPWNFSLRYFLSPLLLLLLAPAAAAEFVWNEPRCRKGLKVAVVVVLLMALAERFNRPKGHPGEGLKYLLGRVDEAEVSDASVHMASLVNARAQPSQRVYLATHYTYGLRPELLASASTLSERREIRDIPSPAGRWRSVYEKGFRWICLDSLCSSLRDSDRSFTVRRTHGDLDSRLLPEDLELLCRYWGPAQPRPEGYAVFELRRRSEE